MIAVELYTNRNRLPRILMAPNLKSDNLNAKNIEIEIRKGYPKEATKNASTGSGLNSKKSVLENGNDNEESIPEPDSQTGTTAKIIMYAETEPLLLIFKYLEMPTMLPMLHKNIPVISMK